MNVLQSRRREVTTELTRLLFRSVLLLACTLATAYAGLKEGLDALINKKYSQGIAVLSPLAEKGDPESQYVLGVYYSGMAKNADQFPRDINRGIDLLTKAAASPETRKMAALTLQVLFREGDGIPKDGEKEAYWWEVGQGLLETRKAAEAGDLNAAMKLGVAYRYSSLSVYDGEREAAKWLAKVAEAGTLTGEAAAIFGCFHHLGKGGIQQDFEKTRYWVEIGHDAAMLKQAAQSGDAKAMTKLGDMYTKTCLGNTNETSARVTDAEARKWYEKAVANGEIAKAWDLFDLAKTEQEQKHWAEIGAAIVTPDGKPSTIQYGGNVLFENLPHRDLPWGYRHAPGKSYLTLRPVSVYEKPDAASPITEEIGRFHIIYARSEKPGWLAIIAASLGRHPDRYQYLTPSVVQDGKFVPRRRFDRNGYIAYVGFVRGDALVSMDEEPPMPPLPARGLVPVPAYWEPIGIPEGRHFVTDLNQHPYDALVMVANKRGNSCSGAIVLVPTIVVTSGHCFKTVKDEVDVLLGRGQNAMDSIRAQIVEYRNEDGNNPYADWAVLRLERVPMLPVTPLHFADGMDWSRTARFWGVRVGYPGDLYKISEKRLGFTWPSVSRCLVNIGEYSSRGKDSYSISHECSRSTGDSGGPFIVWDPETERFEILALNTSDFEGFFGDNAKKLFQEDIFRNHAPVVLRQFDMRNEATLFNTDSSEYKGIPGVASAVDAYRSWTNSQFSDYIMLSNR